MQAVLTSRLNSAAPEFNPRLGTKLNPAATAFHPALRNCQESTLMHETRVSRYRIGRTGGSGRLGRGSLHPSCATKRKASTAIDMPKNNRDRKISLSVEIRRRIRLEFFSPVLCWVRLSCDHGWIPGWSLKVGQSIKIK